MATCCSSSSMFDSAGARFENRQAGELSAFVEFQHHRKFLQKLARQFPDKMAVRGHLAALVLAQFHADEMRIEADFNSTFAQSHQPVRRNRPIVFAKPAVIAAV